jgi:uncharacterized protein (TIRG00374 family)
LTLADDSSKFFRVIGVLGRACEAGFVTQTDKKGSSQPEWMRLLRWFVKAGISLGLIALLLYHANLENASGQLANLHLGWLGLAVLIKGTGILAGVIRWKILLGGQDIHLKTTNLGGAYLIGRFFGAFLPSTIGLDVYRTYYTSVRTRKVAKCVAVTVVEKVIGLFALSGLALAAIPFGMRMLPEKALWLLGLAMCAPIGVSAILLLWPGLFLRIAALLRKRERKISGALARMSEAVGTFGRQRGRLAVATLWGFVVHAGTISMYSATARAVGVTIPATEILFVGPLMVAATLVPLSIAGIGLREGSYVFFLAAVGVPTEQAVLLAFLGFLAGEVYSLAGGGVWALKPASRPEEGDGLIEVVKRVARWTRGRDGSRETGEEGVAQ